MSWFRRREIRWSGHDAETLVKVSLADVEAAIGQKLYVTASGVVADDALRTELTTILRSSERPTTLQLLAVDLDVSVETLKHLLEGSDFSNLAIYVGSSILPEPVVRDLQRKLANAARQFVTQLNFCKENSITMEQLRWLAQRDDHLRLMNNLIVNNSELSERVENFITALSARSHPIKVSSIEMDEQVRELLLQAAGARLEGRYDRQTGIFTPDRVVEASQERARRLLEQNGYVSLDGPDLKGIRNLAKFAKANAAQVVDSYLVGNDFIERQAAEVKKTVEDVGFASKNDIPLDQSFRELVISANKRYEIGYKNFLVKKSFEAELLSQAKSLFERDKKDNIDEMLAKRKLSTTDNARDLVSRLPLPTQRDVLDQLIAANPSLPENFNQEFAERHYTSIRKDVFESAVTQAQTEIDKAQRELDLKIAAYLLGLATVPESLRQNLFEEWQLYVTENGGHTIGSVRQALEQYPNQLPPAQIHSVATGLVESQRKKLFKVTDAALALHLATVIYHAEHFAQPGGVLKFTGKLVPRILKAFEFPPPFIKLKSAITKKGTAKSEIALLVNEVKHSVGEASSK